MRAQPVNGPTGEQLSSTVGQMVPSRPLSEEHDEEVAVHELRGRLLAVKMRTSVAPGHPRRTGRSVQRPDNGTESRGKVGGDRYRRTIVPDCRSKGRGASTSILRRARRGGGCARASGQSMKFTMHRWKASNAPDHPRETGRLRVECQRCRGEPWRGCCP